MLSLPFRRMHVVTLAAAAITCLTASEKLVAADPNTAPNVTYTATGSFASTPISGGDVFKLAGQKFTISVVANAATVPTSNGAQWSRFTSLPMTGTIGTGLTPTPFPIQSKFTSLELATGNPSYQLFVMFAPVTVVDTPIYVIATLHMPTGTIAKALIHPFPAITLGPCTLPSPPGPCVDTVIYSDPNTGASTTLGIASGTLDGTIPSGGVNQE